MPLNVTMGQMLTKLRNTIGASADPSQMQSYDNSMIERLTRVQEWLYDEWNWEHMIYYSQNTLLPNERYYTFNSDVNFERIIEAKVQYPTTLWRTVYYGIDPDNYNYSNAEIGVTSDPVQRWQRYNQLGDDPSVGQFEVWPMPATQQYIRFQCIRKLRTFASQNDRCDLDSNLIVLFAAGEILKEKKADNAKDVQGMAQRIFDKLKGQNNKIGSFTMNGGMRSNANRQGDWTIRIRGT